jgi:AraC-like DNA-binding protein
MIDALDGESPTLRRLRRHLAVSWRKADVAGAARALSISPRSLQRALQEAGTSFRFERDRARVRAAEALLVDGDAKLDAIAATLGCSARSSFFALFRRHTGETPDEFRARRRPSTHAG